MEPKLQLKVTHFVFEMLHSFIHYAHFFFVHKCIQAEISSPVEYQAYTSFANVTAICLNLQPQHALGLEKSKTANFISIFSKPCINSRGSVEKTGAESEHPSS